MIKYLFYFFILFFMPINSFAGPSVVGTRFLFNSETRAINIKVMNDNENDYLIKTSINNKEFIVSPPLFILPKNASNIITIIPSDMIKNDRDKIYELIITAIPKSEKNSGNNIVSLAVRSHFNLIYQHKKPDDNDFNNIKLTKDSSGKYCLENNSDIIFNIEWSTDKEFKSHNRKILSLNKKLDIKECKPNAECQVWINVLADNDIIIKQLNLLSDK